jgi:hypothetical protein
LGRFPDSRRSRDFFGPDAKKPCSARMADPQTPAPPPGFTSANAEWRTPKKVHITRPSLAEPGLFSHFDLDASIHFM